VGIPQSAFRIPHSKRRWQFILCLLLPLFLLFFVLSQARAEPEDTLLFREGEVLLSRGETEKALWRFKTLTTEFPKSPLSNEARFRMGICYTRLKRPKDAIRILNELFSTFLSPPRMVQVLTLLGDNYLESKDPLQALQWYGKGLLVRGPPQEELKRKMRSIIDTYDREEDLLQIESLYRGAYGGGYAKLKLAQMAKSRGNDALAKKILSEWEQEYRGMDYGPLAKELRNTLLPSEKPKYSIGVILPLSGDYQSYGERVLQGIHLALREVESHGKNPSIQLVVRDSKGNPSEAERVVEELATEEKVVAIIGPLLAITAEKAARKAQQLEVPLLTLSQRELPPDKGDYVFQNSLSPSDQIQVLVTYVLKEMWLRTFAIFYPNSPYGSAFKNIFVQEVARGGGKVVGTVAYSEDQTDFGKEIKSFFKIKSAQSEGSRKNSEEEFKAQLAVDVLFIPDTYDRAGILLSQMAYYNVGGVTFLGTNAWNHPDLIPIARKSAEGSIFVDAFFKENRSPLVLRFVEGFRKAYQRDPETLDAMSYDGAKLIMDILHSKTISSPSEMKDELLRVQNFKGVSGLKGFAESGRAIRNLSLLKVNKGKIELIPPW
jgi:ABC-type branched-subunit amino acid transport system substrate-binding protein